MTGPVRTCIGCGTKAPAADMVRLRAIGAGLALGAGPGRGAWLCGSHPVACLDEARKRRTIGRALRTERGNDEIEHVRARLVHGGVTLNDAPGSARPPR